MAWVTAIVGLVGAYEASQSKPDASQNNQTGLANLQQKIGQNQWDQYQQVVQPRTTQFINNAFDESLSPSSEAARAGAEAAQAADTSAAVADRNARRLGINPSSPAYAAIQRQDQADRAGLISSASTYGRRYARQTNFNDQLAALGLGSNLVTNAGNLNSSAFNMNNTLTNLQANQDAQKGSLYGNAAGSLADAIKQWSTSKNTPQVSTMPESKVPTTWNDYTPPTAGGLTDSLTDKQRMAA